VSFCEKRQPTRQPNPLPPYSKDLGTHMLAVALPFWKSRTSISAGKADPKFRGNFREIEFVSSGLVKVRG